MYRYYDVQVLCDPHFSYLLPPLPDIDECVKDPDACGQNCTNTNGSFVCSCGMGYILNEDGITCDGMYVEIL